MVHTSANADNCGVVVAIEVTVEVVVRAIHVLTTGAGLVCNTGGTAKEVSTCGLWMNPKSE